MQGERRRVGSQNNFFGRLYLLSMHCVILAAVIISSRIRRLTSKRNSGVTVTYPKSKRL
jgi:hypothetical protein